MDSSTTNLLGILGGKPAANGENTNKNQLVEGRKLNGVFRQLLELQAHAKGHSNDLKSVKELPVNGKLLPEAVAEKLKNLSTEQLIKLADVLSRGNKTDLSPFSSSIQRLTSLTAVSSGDAGQPEEIAFEAKVKESSKLLVWSDDQLVDAAKYFGVSESVARAIVSKTVANNPQIAETNNVLVKDEDVLALAKTLTAQQLKDAGQFSSGKQGELGAENKSGVISLLKEMDGKVKFSSEKNPAKTDTGKLITADSFLAERTSVKETFDGKLKATLDSAITSKQEAVTPNASLASTAARFLDQRQLITRKVATENSVITPEEQPGQAVLSSSNGIDASEKIQTEVTKTGASFKDAQFLTQNSDRFQQALGERLMKMIESGKWNAEMELNPKRLGVVRISMALDNNEMQLAMSSNNSAVRDLLEGSLAKLRDGLNESGITLANAFVGQDSTQDESKGSFADKDENGDNRVAFSSSDRVANQDEEKVVNVVKHNGDLDTFA